MIDGLVGSMKTRVDDTAAVFEVLGADISSCRRSRSQTDAALSTHSNCSLGYTMTEP